MLRDAVTLQRNEQREQRLELGEKRLEFDREKLQFAVERFEAGKQSDVRRVMTAFLVAAKQWPEVQEALAGAFRLLQERKGAKTGGKEAGLEPIKVNEGEINKKIEEAQTGLECCSPSWRDSQPQSACFAGSVPDGLSCRIRLRYTTARRGATNSTSHGLHESITTSTATGVRMEGNEAELKPIQVNPSKSNHFYPGRERSATTGRGR